MKRHLPSGQAASAPASPSWSRRWPLPLCVIALPAVLMALALAAFTSVAVQVDARSEIAVVGLDMETSGNAERTVADIDSCASVAPGESLTLEVAIPEPGVPAPGISAYQFRIFYDPAIVWVTEDEPVMLLAAAQGSSLVPYSDTKPDKNGIYNSAAVDFGPKGTEPQGASETGAGVLARVTLSARQSGSTPLILRDVIIQDDRSENIEVVSKLSGRMYVGAPCPGHDSIESTPTAMPPGPATTALAEDSGRSPSEEAPAGIAGAGGPPSAPGKEGWVLVAAGAGLGGSGLMGLYLGLSGADRQQGRPSSRS